LPIDSNVEEKNTPGRSTYREDISDAPGVVIVGEGGKEDVDLGFDDGSETRLLGRGDFQPG